MGWLLLLCLFFVSARTFKCNFNHANSRFFKAFNAVYGKVGRLASDEVVLGLLRSKCLSVLLYTTEACPLLSRNKQSLDFTITRSFMKISPTGSPAIVRKCQFNFLILRLFNHRSIFAQLDFCTSLSYLNMVCVRCLQLTLHINWARSHYKLRLSEGC